MYIITVLGLIAKSNLVLMI